MLYILLGQDDFSIDQTVKDIKGGIGDQTLLAANTNTLDGRQVTLDQLKTVCETAPFLAERRLVIVNGLLERFERKGTSSRQEKIGQSSNQQNKHKSFGTYISKIPDSTVLVLVDRRIGSSNPLLRELSAKAVVKSFPLLKGTKLQQWIQRHITGQGSNISPQALNLLAELVGSDLRVMVNEINKLVSFTAGRRIEEEDVKMVVSHALQANIFTMVDAVLQFKAGVAQQSLQQLLRGGSAPAYLLVMLSRQVQMAVRIKELRSQRKTEAEIQNRLGLTSVFALRKTLERVDRYPSQRLKRVYDKLLEADLSIKTGKYDGALALNILVAELCQRDNI